jgi:2-C-methyl-D-erythritol 4-phosphate cytidylyltransferase
LNYFAIIVAAGRGSRMNTPVPKQFLKLNGKPVLLHSIQAFYDFNADTKIILVLPADQFDQWERIKSEYHPEADIRVVAGGETRFESVNNGLKLVPDNANNLVAVHDAVRPLVSKKTIVTAFKAAERYGSGVPALPLNDSIRMIESASSIAVDRSKYCLIQTPQCFLAPLLKRAYQQEYRYTFTDDASVVESTGETIRLVDGNTENLKLTTPIDMALAEALIAYRLQHANDLTGGTHS